MDDDILSPEEWDEVRHRDEAIKALEAQIEMLKLEAAVARWFTIPSHKMIGHG